VFDSETVQVIFLVKYFLRSFALSLCSGMYRIYQFLTKVMANSTGKLLDSLDRNVALVREFNVAYCHDTEGKLPPPT
jgi:hypothetical protein